MNHINGLLCSLASNWVHPCDTGWGFPDGSVGKESTCNAGGTGDAGLISGLGRSPGEGNATHPSILAWKIPWTEEAGRLQSMGSQRVRHNRATSTIYSLTVGNSNGKESAHNLGDLGLIPGSRRSPGGGHGNPLQYSCQENTTDRGAWWATVPGVKKSQT